MSQQTDLPMKHKIIFLLIFGGIVVGGFLFDRYLKDNDLRDTYGDVVERLHQKMNTWDCEKLLKWGYFTPSGLYSTPNMETTYAKDLAREKCPLDESWKNPEIKIKETVPTMDELYDKWSKQK